MTPAPPEAPPPALEEDSKVRNAQACDDGPGSCGPVLMVESIHLPGFRQGRGHPAAVRGWRKPLEQQRDGVDDPAENDASRKY